MPHLRRDAVAERPSGPKNFAAPQPFRTKIPTHKRGTASPSRLSSRGPASLGRGPAAMGDEPSSFEAKWAAQLEAESKAESKAAREAERVSA